MRKPFVAASLYTHLKPMIDSSETDLARVLARIEAQLKPLLGTGENWKITINGSPRDVRIEVQTFETLKVQRPERR